MTWAIFNEPFNYDRRPAQAIAFAVKPGMHNLPRDVVDAAVAAGKARRIRSPGKGGDKQYKQPDNKPDNQPAA